MVLPWQQGPLDPGLPPTLSRHLVHPAALVAIRNAGGHQATLGEPENQLAERLSQINDDVAARLRAANENVAISGLIQWLRSVDDRP